MPEVAQQNDIYQVRVQGRIEGQETNNVLHFKCVSGAGDADVEVHLILVLIQCFITHILPVITQGWTLERVLWKRVTPTLGPEIISVPQGQNFGSGSDFALPSFVSVVFSIRTAQGGRSKRGRMYLPGIPRDQAANSALDPNGELWAGVLAFAQCFVTNFIIADPPGNNAWHMGVYSRKIGGSTFPYGAAGFTPMKEFVPHMQLGTTRSRKVGRGS